jgi:hypothetical protein
VGIIGANSLVLAIQVLATVGIWESKQVLYPVIGITYPIVLAILEIGLHIELVVDLKERI